MPDFRNEMLDMAVQRRMDRAKRNVKHAVNLGVGSYASYRASNLAEDLGQRMMVNKPGSTAAIKMLKAGKYARMGSAGMGVLGVASAVRAIQNWKRAKQFRQGQAS